MDKKILNILKKLEKYGYKAYIVGGFVRDYILGIESNDIDICTNALPKDVINILKLDKTTKDNYGSVNIRTKKYNIDITTFRKESEYINHRPKSISYIKDIKEDLKRRDFTINTLLMNSNEEILDYYNALEDINNKKIKCIINTHDKLSEDPLRILRALRLSIIYDFKIDDEILDFIKNNKSIIKEISYFRRKEELDKILISKNRIKGLNLLKKLNLLKVLEINFNNVKDTNDIIGIYSQINFCEKYPFTKNEQDLIKKIKEVIKQGSITIETLYKYGLYINLVAGNILDIDNITINKMYNALPIKSRKDIKINTQSIVKLNNNCYNNINEIYELIEDNILKGILNNKNKDIIKFLRK
ncbi:MAG: hypothetical protein IJD92_02105 [Bacilli bacterium]|nr:hypothetical protein [Bacilli bacterium]